MRERDHSASVEVDIALTTPTAGDVRRKLAVIAADLVGYSELVFRDPHAAVKLLRETREVVIGAIRARKGAILGMPGDFVLATFDELDAAVAAAVAAQEGLFARHGDTRADQGGHWKIGIEFGEVFAVGEDYYGNAINVAARLQALAGPGDIFVTSAVRDGSALPDRLKVQQLGPKRLKNIDQPVDVYRTFLPAYDALIRRLRSSYRTPAKLLQHLRRPVLRLEPFRIPPKSGKADLFAQALVEEVHLILSRLANSISVTAEPTRDTAHDYVLSGSIQSGGPHLRVLARLVSCSDGLTLWMESYDCDLRRRFDLQDQIAREIVSSLQLALTEGEQAQLWRRGTESGRAWIEFQRGHDFERRYTRQGHRQAIEHYRQALSIDPNYLSAMVSLAFCHLDEVRLGWSADASISIAEAEQLCTRAMRFDRHPDVQALLAFLRFFQGRQDEALAAMEEAVNLASQSPEIIGYQGALSDLMEDYGAAILAYTRALSLSVHSPAWIASNLGLSYLAVDDNEEGERVFREVLEHHPNYVRAWIGLAVALIREGKAGDAAHAARSVLSLDPHFTSREWAYSQPFRDARLLSRFVADMRATGLP